MSQQLRSIRRQDTRRIYKADGVVRIADDAEILLVETAGPFGLDNPTRLSFDNSKGMFGLLAMIKTIADKYSYASMATFKKLKLLFLQPYRNALCLWVLSYS
ncbi:hypothetical protein EDC96DRAFT_490920 [Choanephora cucurbitarum]|nr:hypothetical protein EDC96DRAFT_490920 [Choanephora cucurbitarum]